MARNAARSGSNRDATRRACHGAFRSSVRGGPLRRQGGVYIIIFGLSLLFIIGLCGFALDISRVYNRKAELQAVADAAALAAARELNGSLAGVTNAENKAASVVGQLKYQYSTVAIPWSSNALRFSASATAADSAWLDSNAAKAAPAGIMFVKVDTNELAAEVGLVDTILLRVVPDAPLGGALRARAIAGRVSTNVTPLAVCAISNAPQSQGSFAGPPPLSELVQYGFRRGSVYDLMQLNSNGLLTAHFAVDAGDPLGTRDAATNTSAAFIAPFVCNGSMLATTFVGQSITVSAPFPIDTLFNHLNTRFGSYTGTTCTSLESPPDSNIKSYVATGTVNPLWAYAKAVPYSSYTSEGPTEPAAGFTPFPSTTASNPWPTLYPGLGPYPGTAPKVNYPATTPYLTTTDANFFLSAGAALAPSKKDRRVLNVPLLQCPVSTSGTTTATVLAIGRFFMTVPATSSSVKAEFAGLMREKNVDVEVELIQ
jgi:Flp pilus assembly protein TadG